MSVISSRKSLNTSILKSSTSRQDSIKKAKVLRFEVNLQVVKNILKELEDNPSAKSYQNLIYKLSEADVKVIIKISFKLRHIFMPKVILFSCFFIFSIF